VKVPVHLPAEGRIVRAIGFDDAPFERRAGRAPGTGRPPEYVARALSRITDRGNVPEPLRLAHLIGAALTTGVSGRWA
jgi:endonuclease V-like protein UPF0215 family